MGQLASAAISVPLVSLCLANFFNQTIHSHCGHCVSLRKVTQDKYRAKQCQVVFSCAEVGAGLLNKAPAE